MKQRAMDGINSRILISDIYKVVANVIILSNAIPTIEPPYISILPYSHRTMIILTIVIFIWC